MLSNAGVQCYVNMNRPDTFHQFDSPQKQSTQATTPTPTGPEPALATTATDDEASKMSRKTLGEQINDQYGFKNDGKKLSRGANPFDPKKKVTENVDPNTSVASI